MKIRSGKLQARVVPVRDLSPGLVEEMWQLFAYGYEGVTREQFARDLAAKDAVILGFDRGDQTFQGFSTFELYEHRDGARTVAVLFSGDTMVRPAYWGQTAMQAAFAGVALRQFCRRPFTPLYWFMTSMGYRTYLTMARNFPRRYWPRHDAQTPARVEALIGSLARRRYGDAWDAERGVIRFARSQGALAPHVAPITASLRAANPEVEFLVQRNPDYHQGVELACVARVTLRDLLAAGLKMLRKTLVRACAKAGGEITRGVQS
jgi:hypothetical protein